MKKYIWNKYALIIGLLLIVVPIMLSLPATKQYAANYVAKQISNSLGTYIDVKEVEITSLTSGRVKNLVVKDKEDKLFLQAEELDINVNIWGLLAGKKLDGIDSLVLKQPIVNLRERNDGKWNYEDFVNKDKSSQEPTFAGKVKIEKGKLNLDLKGKIIKLNNIQATVDLKNLDKIPVVAESDISQGHILINGTVGSKANTNVNIEGSNIDLIEYLAFVPKEYKNLLDIKSSKLNNFKLNVILEEKPIINGYVKLEDIAFKYGAYTVEKGSTLINFQGKNLRFFAKGKIGESQVKGFGVVNNYMEDPVVESEIAADKFVYEHNEFKNIKAKVSYAHNKIYVADGMTNYGAGIVKVKGYYDLENSSYGGDLQVRDVDLWQIPLLQNRQIGGLLTAKVLVEGQGTEFDKANFVADGEVKGAYYQGIAWQKLSFSLSKKADVVTLNALNGYLQAGGSITAKGVLQGEQLQGEVFGSKVNLGVLNRYLPQLCLTGEGNLYAKITGNINNPQANVIFDGNKGSILGRKFDDLRFKGTVSKDLVNITSANLSVNNKPIYEATGTIQLSTGQLDLNVNINQGRIENMLKAANMNLPLTGNLDNQVHITGTINAPEAKGSFRLWDGSYAGALLQEIKGDYELRDGLLVLPNIEVLTPFVKGNVMGTVSTLGALDLVINGENIDISRFPIKYPYPIKGMMEFKGVLKGNINNPIFEGQLSGEKISFNKQDLTDVKTDISLRDNLLQIKDLGFKLGTGTFKLNGKYNLVNQWTYVVANVDKVDSKAILAMANMKNEILSGEFSGVVEITGSATNPAIHLTGKLPQGYLKDYPLQNVELAIQYVNQVLKINKFVGQQNEGKVAAVGEIDFKNNTIAGQLSANNMNPNLFFKLGNIDSNLNGVVNGDLQVKGNLNKPEADFSVYVKGDGISFDQAYVLGNLKNNIININQGVLKRGDSALKAYGTIPLAALTSKYGHGDLKDEMNMRLYLENTNLEMLPTFFSGVEWATGQVKGNVVVTGTVAKPDLQGSISTENAALKIKNLAKPFTDIKGSILLQDQTIKVDNFTAYLGNGYLKANGSLDINGNGISNYHGKIIARELEVESPYYKGAFNGDLSIVPMAYNGKKIPKLTLNLAFNNVTVAMPPLPENTDSNLPLMGLDINVVVGNNVRAYDPLLYDLSLRGGFSIKGTTQTPQSTGEIVANSGSINVFKNVFKVKVGSIKFNQFNSYFPSLDFKASTKVGRNEIFVSVFGPVDKELTTRLYSEPPMPESEIIKILAFGNNSDGSELENISGADVLSLATASLQMSFLNSIEDNLRNMLHLDQFKINRDILTDANKEKLEANSNEVYNIQIGKYISDKLMLKYTKGINYNLNRFGIQYDFNKNIGIIGEYDKKRGYDIKLEMQWKF